MELPTHTYLDITVSNNSAGVQQQPTPLTFYTRRDADYLFRPNDYFVSVARWSIDCRLPIIVPQLPIGSTVQIDGAGAYYWDTIYYVTIVGLDGLNYQQSIRFYPELSNATQPPPFTTVTSIKSLYDDPYFYVSSVSWWLHSVNKAITTAYTNYITNNPASPQASPYIVYNYDGTFKMVANASFLNAQSGGQNPAPIQIWFNSPFYTLFQFPSQYNLDAILPPFTIINAPDKRRNYLILFNDATQTVGAGPVFEYYTQTEMPSLPFWSPISSISFSSQGIPVEPTNVTPTVILGTDNSTSQSSSGFNNNINVANIITDFEINLFKGYEGRTINYYTPAGEYRLIDIIGNRPLSEINIIVYWRDKIEGGLHSVFLHSGGGASLKLLFRKRNYYSEKN